MLEIHTGWVLDYDGIGTFIMSNLRRACALIQESGHTFVYEGATSLWWALLPLQLARLALNAASAGPVEHMTLEGSKADGWRFQCRFCSYNTCPVDTVVASARYVGSNPVPTSSSWRSWRLQWTCRTGLPRLVDLSYSVQLRCLDQHVYSHHASCIKLPILAAMFCDLLLLCCSFTWIQLKLSIPCQTLPVWLQTTLSSYQI